MSVHRRISLLYGIRHSTTVDICVSLLTLSTIGSRNGFSTIVDIHVSLLTIADKPLSSFSTVVDIYVRF